MTLNPEELQMLAGLLAVLFADSALDSTDKLSVIEVTEIVAERYKEATA